ncbi:MAG: glycoside hydrolase family 32 protein [Acidimicrobiia bacterium]|nr:glycoside hydrolase family 32 protein [Acidimicrobiia bacterium]MYG58779.1 glycoside hydrolase family 32 protein [Acidimicrobiia bacterium]MYJ33503.1 glycoside hydrolase family 32 protein [Acidimicrobiia bacterium]
MAEALGHLAPTRPAVHLTPPRGWMNDPNGLCYLDGRWHAFYQHNPDDIVWGPMHWGHASSADLITWDHHPVALRPDELGTIFSGSAVIDHDNTAGFGAGALVAVFTQDLDGHQRQSIAASVDSGLTWEKFEGNPVLEVDAENCRDPKVISFDDGDARRWAMVLAVGNRIQLYRSADLKSWNLASEFTWDLEADGVWECPDLLRLPGHDSEWLLTFCVDNAGPYGHSACLAVPGQLVGVDFLSSAEPTPVDHGPDFYALQSFHAAPVDGPVLMGWMNSSHYSNSHPSNGWRGVLSMPRQLSFAPNGRLLTTPAVDLAAYGSPCPGNSWTSQPGRALYVRADGPFLAEVSGQGGLTATVEIDDHSASITRHGEFMDQYAQRYEAELGQSGGHQIVIDHGTVEVFAAGGQATLSALVFPGEAWDVQIDGRAEMRSL